MENQNSIYIAPDGKKYKRIGVPLSELPEFSVDSNGALVYKYDKDQVVHDFSLDSNGYLTYDNPDWVIIIGEDGAIESKTSWQLIQDTADETMQKNIDLLRLHNKQIQIRATLLDTNYIAVEQLTGRIKGMPSYEVDGESDIRRTCSLTLSLPSKEQMQLDFEKTWNNRMVELACGIYDVSTNDYVWYNLGRMLMTSGESVFDATTQDIRLNLVDLMASMTQERGSQIGETYMFKSGDNVKNLVMGVVAENTAFSSNMNVCEFDDTVPYDEYSNQGDYAINVLHLLFDLFPYYEFFYDVNGVFTARKIPTKISDPVDIGADIIDDMLISEKKTADFSKIKNTTEIWGRSINGDYVGIECKAVNVEDDIYRYQVTIDADPSTEETFTELVSGEKYTIVPETNSVAGHRMKIQSTPEYGIYTVDGAGINYTPIKKDEMKAGVAYVLRYFEERFILEGELQIRCIVQEVTEEPSNEVKEAYKTAHSCDNVKWNVNPDSPYACTINPVTGNIQGEIRQLLTGGEYDNIYTTQLAYERANYENWLACRQQDEVEIEIILIPWMDVSDKIQYTSPVSGELTTWLVKAISYDFNNWTMTVRASRFYPYYPWEG